MTFLDRVEHTLMIQQSSHIYLLTKIETYVHKKYVHVNGKEEKVEKCLRTKYEIIYSWP